MKKIMAVILIIACLVLGVSACKKADAEPEQTEVTTEATTVATTAPEILTERAPVGTPIGDVAEAATPEQRFAKNPALLLWEGNAENTSCIVPYLSSESAGTIILVQGLGDDGGYYISEGEPVAKFLASRGYDVFICKYRLEGYVEDTVIDVGRAVKYVKYYAEEFGLGSQKISVMGFGIGAWLGYIENCDGIIDVASDDIASCSEKADALIMVNPVLEPDTETFAGLAPIEDPAYTSKICVFYEADIPTATKILNFAFWLKTDRFMTMAEVHSINNTVDYKVGSNRTADYEAMYVLLDNFIKII